MCLRIQSNLRGDKQLRITLRSSLPGFMLEYIRIDLNKLII